jgi:hypothetical protein
MMLKPESWVFYSFPRILRFSWLRERIEKRPLLTRT